MRKFTHTLLLKFTQLKNIRSVTLKSQGLDETTW